MQSEAEAGSLLRMEGDEVPAFLSLKMSPHQIGVPDMLFAAKLKDLYPRRVLLWGVQPEWLDIGLELSPPVAARVDEVVGEVVRQLEEWGIEAERQ